MKTCFTVTIVTGGINTRDDKSMHHDSWIDSELSL